MSSKFRAALIATALGAAAILYGCASRESVAQVDAPKSFPREQIAKGEELAHIGNCLSCHTAEGGKPYAGGTPLKTPFGTIYGTNITPDPETGVGRWSPEAFSVRVGQASHEEVTIANRNCWRRRENLRAFVRKPTVVFAG